MIKTATVKGVQYNIALASAVNQKTLMTMISARVALNSAASEQGIDVKFLVGILMSTPESDLDKLSSILLHKTVINGKDSLVALDDFAGNMSGYFTLLAEALKVNLDDFFTWLDSENLAARTAAEKPKA